MSSGRAQAQLQAGIDRGLPPREQIPVKSLVLGVFPDPEGLVRSSQQAEQLAHYLTQVLPVSVKVKEFSRLDTFIDWFIRYRMVDLAVLSPAAAKDNLGTDYVPLAKLLHVDRQGKGVAELVVMRHGQNDDMQAQLQRALLDMTQTAEGRALLTALSLRDVLVPEDVSGRQVVFEYQPEPMIEKDKPLVELPAETAKMILPPVVEYSEPTEPVPPSEIALATKPILPLANEPVSMPPVIEITDIARLVPDISVIPDEPVPPKRIADIVSTDVAERLSDPLQPQNPESVDIILPMVPSDPIGIDEPPAVSLKAELPDVTQPLSEPALLPVDPVAPVPPEEVGVPPLLATRPDIQPPEIQPLAETAAQLSLPDLPDLPDLPGAEEPLPQTPVPAPVEMTPPPLPEQATLIVLPETEQSAPTAVDDVNVVVEALEAQVVAVPQVVPEVEVESESFVSEEPFNYEQQEMVSDALKFSAVATPSELAGVEPVIIDENKDPWSEEEFAAVLAEDMVAAVVSQPDLPPELRPSGVPVVRPGRAARTREVSEDQVLVASLPEPLRQVEPPRPPKLLPDEEPEPGIVYIVPFVGVMVPKEVNTRIFDQFVDRMNLEGEALELQFVILKSGLQRVSPEWLAVRQYVTGEIYAYVEDSSCCSTDLRTKAKLTYHRPNQATPPFGYEYPVKRFFDHDRSSVEIERTKLADDIAETLSSELIKALRN